MALVRLTATQIKKIKDNKATFQKAQDLTGVPWQAVAALWFRESFSVAPPDRVGGQFQFDPPLTAVQMRLLLTKFTKLDAAGRDAIITAGQEHFASAAVLAACFLRNKAKAILSQDHSDEAIKDAFYGYNGRKYGGVDKSPYVMSQYSEAFANMRIRGTVPDKKNPKIKVWVDTPDNRPGAFTVYRQLVDAKV